MELIKTARKHGSLVSEIVYFILNVGLALGVFGVVYLFPNLPVLAYLLVILSKWRIFAVRPRFWWDNFQTNLLDLLLGLSVVTLLATARDEIVLQIAITVLYGIWLVVLKPMSSRLGVQTQATIAQFVAVTALFSTAYAWSSWTLVVIMWLIGYISARHMLGAYEEDEITLLSLVWGFLMAEIGWVAYHWTIAYSVGSPDSIFKIPQIAIIITMLSYFVGRSYGIYKKKGTMNASDVLWPGLFVAGTILVILIFFNGLDPINS